MAQIPLKTAKSNLRKNFLNLTDANTIHQFKILNLAVLDFKNTMGNRLGTIVRKNKIL